MQNLVEFVHFLNIFSYLWKVMKWCIEKKYVFLVTYCKRFHPKSPLYDKLKMTTKRITLLESFVIVGSFDCDRTSVESCSISQGVKSIA